MTGAFKYRSVARTHQGLVRSYNEDSYFERPDLGLWAVADGMGGLTSGDVASQSVVRTLALITRQDSGAGFVAEIKARLADANAELQALAASRHTPTPIGSTVAGLLVFADHFACFWAGDSRVYRLRRGDLDRLTRDHSLVQDIVDSGLLAPDRAESHPHASVIQRAVGVEEKLELEFTHARIEPGDLFLLCSDGLTRMVSDEELELELGRLPLEQACDVLIATVLERGAKDNVTIVLVMCLEGDASQQGNRHV